MPSLQKIYDDTSPGVILEIATGIVARKLAKKGVRFTPALKRKLKKWLGAGIETDFVVGRCGPNKQITVTFTTRDFRRLRGQFSRLMTERTTIAATEMTMRLARPTLRKIRTAWKAGAKHELKSTVRFERRLAGRWRTPLNLLELQLQLARETGGELNDELRGRNKRKLSALVDSLTRLHARCCLITGEVVALIRAGYANGAMTRWRSLHEATVVMDLLSKHGNDLAKRYLDYDAVDSWRAAEQYNKFSDQLGLVKYTDSELAAIKAKFDAAVLRHGPGFDKTNGWVASILPKKKIDFLDLEAAADLSHLRPYYKLASHGVHAGPKGVLFEIGLVTNESLLLVGPSNFGFTDPGHNAALALNRATAILLMQAITDERMLTMQVMTELTRDIGHAFLKVQKRIRAIEEANRSAVP